MGRPTPLQAALIAAGGGALLFLAQLGWVLATGQTFGQRCSAMGHQGEAHAACVRDLARGR